MTRGARIAVVGSRSLPRDARRVIWNGIAGTPLDAVIVSGGARGPRSKATVSADLEARRAADFYRRTFDELPADWEGLGKRAGYARNEQLVETLSGPEDRLVAIWDGVSPGTRHVVARARAAGVLVRCIVLRVTCPGCKRPLGEGESACGDCGWAR